MRFRLIPRFLGRAEYGLIEPAEKLEKIDVPKASEQEITASG